VESVAAEKSAAAANAKNLLRSAQNQNSEIPESKGERA
jgi:hypothetical protein